MKKGEYEITIDNVKSAVKRLDGYVLLSTIYNGPTVKLEVKCAKGHIYKTTYGTLKSGKGCRICSINDKKLSYDYVKKQIELTGYKLLSPEYINANQKMRVECNNHHQYDVTYGNFYRGKRCPMCSNGESKLEKEIKEWFKTIYTGDVIENNRTILTNPNTKCALELDIWLPKKNKAIEINGVYWHETSGYDNKKRDIVKKQLCLEKNIDLLVITDNEWKNNNETIKNNVITWINS